MPDLSVSVLRERLMRCFKIMSRSPGLPRRCTSVYDSFVTNSGVYNVVLSCLQCGTGPGVLLQPLTSPSLFSLLSIFLSFSLSLTRSCSRLQTPGLSYTRLPLIQAHVYPAAHELLQSPHVVDSVQQSESEGNSRAVRMDISVLPNNNHPDKFLQLDVNTLTTGHGMIQVGAAMSSQRHWQNRVYSQVNTLLTQLRYSLGNNVFNVCFCYY